MRRTVVGVLDTWARIEAWLADHAPALHGALPEGVDDAAIARAEKQLRLTLPDDLKQILRRHDGAPGVIGGDDLLSLDAIVATRKARREASATAGHDPAAAAYYGARWLPIVSSGALIDLDAAIGFSDWLERIVDDLERGLYPYANGEFAPWATGFALSVPDAERSVRILSPGAPQVTFAAQAHDLELVSLAATRALHADSPMQLAIRAGDRVTRERVVTLPHDGGSYRLGGRYPGVAGVTIALEQAEPGLFILAFDMRAPVDSHAQLLALATRQRDAAIAAPVLDALAALGPLTDATRTALSALPHELAKLCFALHEARSPAASRVADRIAGFAPLFEGHPLLAMLADNCVVACLHAPERAIVDRIATALVDPLPPSDASARASYNLACIYARLGDLASVLAHLAIAIARGTELAQIHDDADFAGIATEPRFRELLARHAPDFAPAFLLSIEGSASDAKRPGVVLGDVAEGIHASRELLAIDDVAAELAAAPVPSQLVPVTRLGDAIYVHPRLALADAATWQRLVAAGLPMRGHAVLTYPARAGHAAAVQLLLDAKANPNKGNPLALAATAGHEAAAQVLVRGGAKLGPALGDCARAGSLVGVRLLMKLGARTTDLDPAAKKHVINLGTPAMRTLLKV